MALEKPDSVKLFLDAFVVTLNIPPWDISLAGYHLASEGEWVSLTLDFGMPAEVAIDAVLVLINVGLDLLEAGKATVEALGNLYTVVLEVIETNVVALVKRIVGEVADIYESIAATVDELYTAIWAVIASVADILPAITLQISDAITAAATTIKEEVLGQVAGLITAALEPWKQVINTISLFVDDINDLFSDPEDWLYRKIDAMIDRFW